MAEYQKNGLINERSFALPDLAATAALSARLGPLLRAGDVVALYGGLGAGKTAFARGLIQALQA
ncbi:MAG: tRNA (adenosine(37)-N6)-threonylcarbamoyltransferase complex ATPase subunit type 1 TsaE, partial [Alphaproteobacteria bacterium]|nr:tRNA (adenosine(37)-N6)-threonylcarbamoyltransferase complex ATPase subunit type 1 TsaE [Alphaproteobacteria bacterium]